MANLPDDPRTATSVRRWIETMGLEMETSLVAGERGMEMIQDARVLRARRPGLPNIRITLTVETCEGDL